MRNLTPLSLKCSFPQEGQVLTVLTDRSEGGSSLQDGQLELMLHRQRRPKILPQSNDDFRARIQYLQKLGHKQPKNELTGRITRHSI